MWHAVGVDERVQVTDVLWLYHVQPLRRLECPRQHQARIGWHYRAYIIPSLDSPVEQCVVRLTLGMRQSQYVPMRPLITRLILDQLVSQLFRRLTQVPVGDSPPQHATPAAELL